MSPQVAEHSAWRDGDKPVRAMPDRGLFLDGKVYVSLNELSDDFMAGGPGRLVVIDRELTVGSVEVDSLARLEGPDVVTPVAESLDRHRQPAFRVRFAGR